jgi:hypothetical protein
MARGFDVVIERDKEGFYFASVPELRDCHMGSISRCLDGNVALSTHQQMVIEAMRAMTPKQRCLVQVAVALVRQ